MLDQANDLRRLALKHGRLGPTERPTLLAVAGGKGGVGTTTVAVGLATALTRMGNRALLIDADPRGGDAALRCHVDGEYNLTELLAVQRNWAETIETSPDGVQVVAGARWVDDCGGRSSVAAERLLAFLDVARPYAEIAVIDVGNGLGRAEQHVCLAADAIVMTTTPEPTVVMATFAAIKTLTGASSLCKDIAWQEVGQRKSDVSERSRPLPPLHLLVNRAPKKRDAERVQYRLDRACQRLLGIHSVENASSLWELSARLAVFSALCKEEDKEYSIQA